MQNNKQYKILETSLYSKLVKKLKKRYKNINDDIDVFTNSINDISKLGTNIGNNIYKARIANSDKNKGKSAGYRLISYLKIENSTITYMYIYDKSDLENISEEQLDKAIIEASQLQNNE